MQEPACPSSCFSFFKCRFAPSIGESIQCHRTNLRCIVENLNILALTLEHDAEVYKQELYRAIREQHPHDGTRAARAILQLRKQRDRVLSQHSRLTDMDLQLNNIQTHDALVAAMRGAMHCVVRLNRRAGPRLAQRMSMRFHQEMALMKQKDRQLQESFDDLEEMDAEGDASDDDAEADEESEVKTLVDQARDAVMLTTVAPASHLPVACTAPTNPTVSYSSLH